MTLSQAQEIFGISSVTAISATELKRLYRDLAKKRHPDTQDGNQKEFVELKEAYIFLAKEMLKHPTVAQSDTRDLKTLSREEMLEKYNQDTAELKNQITLFRSSFERQDDVIHTLKTKVESIVTDFEERKAKLQTELESHIGSLEKNYSGTLLSKIFFFWPKMSENEFWDKYNAGVEEFSQKHAQIDVQFFKEMLEVYGKSLNDISTFVDQAKVDLDKNKSSV